MVDFPGQNPSNSDGNHLVVPPETPEYTQAKSLFPSLSLKELQRLRGEAQSEIDRRIQEQERQRDEEEASCIRRDRRFETRYSAWQPKFLEWRERKDEEWAEKHAKTPKYGSTTESDSEASDGYEYGMEEANTSDLDSEAAEDKRKMNAFHDGKLRSRFAYELANPKIFARTMSEGEPSRVRVSRCIANLDYEESDDEEEEEGGDSEEETSSSGTSPAPSDSDESDCYEDEGWETDEDDWW
ncbi:uncharacterized protein LOC113356230 [Papaver somniferum]|uniref:uncharacterized protein LOC113356230 n=1 Tax=Papaver somniferum TaxID=3469 RepID=UPI000E6F82D0|nr:uncharacterized protein LOC113356230 [Papaver somniferum]